MTTIYKIALEVGDDDEAAIIRLRKFLKRARRTYGLNCIRIERKQIKAESQKSECPLCGGRGVAPVYDPVNDVEFEKQCPFCPRTGDK